MEKTLQEILAKSPYAATTMTTKDMLAMYSHIELTEEEIDLAILHAKQRKEEVFKQKRLREAEEENRRLLAGGDWPPEQTRDFMLWRMGALFKGEFTLDVHSEPIFKLLCHYFSSSPEFIPLAKEYGVKEPSLEKGIVLQGGYGRGKTWMMQLFSRNQRQCFFVKNCKDTAADFEIEGEVNFEKKYVLNEKNAINDRSAFYQIYMGLCLDDIGTEKLKVHYGNRKNVIGDLIEQRYIEFIKEKKDPDRKGTMRIYLHGTTNLTAEELVEMYGGRVTSRMREMFNFIVMGGNDRRK